MRQRTLKSLLTSTVHSFIEAIRAVFRSVAELVEMDALPRADALYVVERTSHRHLCRTCQRQKDIVWAVRSLFLSRLDISSSQDGLRPIKCMVKL